MNVSGFILKTSFLSLPVLAMTLTSCDPQVRGIYQVDNRSDGAIYLWRTDDSTYTDTIPAGGSKVLMDLSELGSSYSTAGPVADLFRSATVVNDTGAVCKTSINSSGNWTTTQVAKWTFEHHFKVTGEDFR